MSWDDWGTSEIESVCESYVYVYCNLVMLSMLKCHHFKKVLCGKLGSASSN